MMKSRQSGLSFIGAILVVILLGCALLVGFKMVGPYQEYFSLQRVIGVVSDEGTNGASEAEMRQGYERRAVIDGFDEAIPASMLRFRREGSRVVIDVEYQRKVPLIGNISLFFDFKASSKDSRK